MNSKLPAGFELKNFDAKEFWNVVDPHFAKIFDDKELILRSEGFLSQREKEKLKPIADRFQHAYVESSLLLHNGKLAGWMRGHQDSRDSFYMVNSAILPEYRRQGLYSKMLDQTLENLADQGFQRVWSRHNASNNAILIPKLKRGFKITAMEVTVTFGTLVHLTYFPNETRQKLIEFRTGHVRPDQEMKDLFKI